jgi:hypothetical protein
MKIKQLIESEGGTVRASFYIDEDGSLVIEFNDELLEIPHLTSLELLEYLRIKLYQHQEKHESILKRLFT